MSTSAIGRILVWGRRFLAAAIVAAAFKGGLAAAQGTNTNSVPFARKPCVIFILSDDLGYGELGCYGQTKIKTPNIDQLAAEGMRFTSFYAGDTLSAGSRSSLMTGKHTGHARMRGSAVSPFTPQDYTLGDMFKQAGYRNAAFGKWGLGSLGTTSEPRYKGFDEWLGFLDDLPAHNYYPETLDRARDGDEHVFALSGNKDNKKGTYACDFFTESAMRFMDFSKPEELNYFRPYFIYLAYQMPHANIELGQATGNGMEVPSDAPYSTEPWPQPERNKAAMITRMDSYVGKILDMLKAQKNDRNTIIIFSSDNGPHSEGGVDQKFFKGAGPFKGGKRDLYEGGIRIPMIVRWPIRIKAGSTCDTPLAFWDVLPTLAEIARVEPPKGIDGISFLPTLTGGKQTNQHEFLYWEVHDKGFKQAVRMGDWKAVRLSADGPLELYNLKSDPGETKNVADQNTEVLAKINEYLKTARTDDPNWPIQKTLPAEPK